MKRLLKRPVPDYRYDHALGVAETAAWIAGLLYAPLSAYVAGCDYGITDIEILNAIKRRQAGRFQMTALDKIVYVSDWTEPGEAEWRSTAKWQKRIWKRRFSALRAQLHTGGAAWAELLWPYQRYLLHPFE